MPSALRVFVSLTAQAAPTITVFAEDGTPPGRSVISMEPAGPLMRPVPSAVATWLSLQTPTEVFLTAVPDGRRRRALERVVEETIREDFRGRVLPFDSQAAPAYARIVSERRAAGRPISQLDAQPGAIALTHAATLATRNVRDFEGCGLDLVDPWAEAP